METITDKLRRQGFVHGAKGREKDHEGELEPWLKWDTIWGAARSGKVQVLKRLVESDRELVHRQNVHQETALHFACKYGHLQCVQVLDEYGAQSVMSDKGKTPVQLAVDHSHADIVKYLCQKNHFGTDMESAQRMLTTASSKPDYGCMVVLQAHINPALANQEEEELRLQGRRERELAEEKRISEEEESVRLQAIIKEVEPLPPLPDHLSWTPFEVKRWVLETFPEESKYEMIDTITRYHLSGNVLFSLTKSELGSLFQRIGFSSPFRGNLMKALLCFLDAPNMYGFTELRNIPVALGNAATFRIIGTVRAAMSTPLQTARRFVSAAATAKKFDMPIPEPFQFISMQNERLLRQKEGHKLVSDLGYVIIISPTPVEQQQQQQE